jgi:hypothetical protein
MSCNTSESHVKPRPLTPLPANWGGEKNTLQKDSAARELGRERERARGGDGGERDDHKRCEEDSEIMLDVGMMSVCVPLSCDYVCVWCLLVLPTQGKRFCVYISL